MMTDALVNSTFDCLPSPDSDTTLRDLFHRLNNQLGVILSHAELLEAKCADPLQRARATQVVNSVLEAMGTTKQIRQKTQSNQ
jgi:hypothetical protein